MVVRAPTQISFFEIVEQGGRAAYNYQVDMAVTAAGYEADIERIANAGILPRGGRRPHRNVARLERYLDIHETREDGFYAYAFYLNAEVNLQQRLMFKRGGPAFHSLPMNDGGATAFLTGFRVYNEQAQGARWASFVCDVEAVRNSALASRIAALPGTLSPHFMTIPFVFDVIDPILDASPWVVPAEGDDDEFDHALLEPTSARVGARSSASASGARRMLTHGGVHPDAASYLSVPL